MDIDFLVEELSLFGIQFQVWHLIYLATGAVAVIAPGSPDEKGRHSVLLSSGHDTNPLRR